MAKKVLVKKLSWGIGDRLNVLDDTKRGSSVDVGSATPSYHLWVSISQIRQIFHTN